MQIHLKTLGCRLNEAEIESWAGKFQKKGHKLITDPACADLLVINTCAVTQEAVKKSRQIIRRIHRNNPTAKLVVSGCYSTLDKKNINELPGIDLVIDNSEKEKLVDISLRELNLETMPSLSTEPGETSLFKRGRNRAFIKIQDGCRHRCTFCIVTIARGEERSRTINEIINEINKNLTQVEKIKKFHLLSESFSIENGLLTPTMKVRRNKVIVKYKNTLENFYKK